VRLSILVRINPDKWTQPAPEGAEGAEEFDADKVIKGLVSAGIPEETAKEMAGKLAPAAPATDPHAPSLVRTQVREYMLHHVQQLAALTDAGATIVDADRQPAKPAAPATAATEPAK
jgi:hypothetical protein